jgi:hypothetical protein
VFGNFPGMNAERLGKKQIKHFKSGSWLFCIQEIFDNEIIFKSNVF